MRRAGIRILFCLLLTFSWAAAADISGIWAGQQEGRRGEPEDVAFRFRVEGNSITGTMFGDEFDVPVEDGFVSGDQVRFAVATTNYYTRTRVVFRYTGTVQGSEIELVRERVQTQEEKAANRPVFRQTLKLKRLT